MTLNKRKRYSVIIEFKKIGSAIEAVGVIKSHGSIHYQPVVGSGLGKYYTIIDTFKTKKAAKDFIEELEEKFNYNFVIKETSI